jgi:uncharacterized oligopeptide transporter (OPT) family protein
MIMGPRTAVSMLGGAVVGWAILGPIAQSAGWTSGPVNDWETGARGYVKNGNHVSLQNCAALLTARGCALCATCVQMAAVDLAVHSAGGVTDVASDAGR